MKNIVSTIALMAVSFAVAGQDIHFAQVKNMQKWYNASLQSENTEKGITLNYRNVSYRQLIAFKSMAALADIPLVSRAERQSDERKGYFGIAGGFSADQSNQGILKNTTALLGISYHLPVDERRQTFISMGLQGAAFQSRINMSGATTPDQFDKHGLIPGSTADDASTAGTIGFISVNTGLSVTHTSEHKVWYAGASFRHLNRPQVNQQGSSTYNLPATIGGQAGYTRISGNNSFGVDVFANFKANAYEHLASVHYTYTFDKSDIDGAIGANIGYRYQDAVIPGLTIRYSKTILGFNYDMAAGQKKSGLLRTAFELGIRQIL